MSRIPSSRKIELGRPERSRKVFWRSSQTG
jgi:hypothetical protein